MKKIIALVIMAAMLLSLAGCAQQPAEEEKTESVEIASALELLNNTWAGYADDEKFAAAGGDSSEENMTSDAPGKFSTEDAELLDSMLGLPAAAAEKIDDAASLMHMMNANTFTCGAYHVTSSDDVSAVVDEIAGNISKRQWMCGFPEELMIITVGDYVVSVFGAKELLDVFQAKLTEAYSMAETAYREPIE